MGAGSECPQALQHAVLVPVILDQSSLFPAQRLQDAVEGSDGLKEEKELHVEQQKSSHFTTDRWASKASFIQQRVWQNCLQHKCGSPSHRPGSKCWYTQFYKYMHHLCILTSTGVGGKLSTSFRSRTVCKWGPRSDSRGPHRSAGTITAHSDTSQQGEQFTSSLSGKGIAGSKENLAKWRRTTESWFTEGQMNTESWV